MHFVKFLFAFFAIAVIATADLSARPARVKPFTHIQPDGTGISVRQIGDEHFNYFVDAATMTPMINSNGEFVKAGFNQAGELVESTSANQGQLTAVPSAELISEIRTKAAAASSGYGLVTRFNNVDYNFVIKGEVPVLVIMVQFSDTKFTYSAADISNLLNADASSVKAYYKKQSNGEFIPTFDVYGTFTASKRATNYANNPTSLATEALRSLQSSQNIDLSKYDVNGDGAVDAVCMIFAGLGGHNDSNGSHIYPANATTSTTVGGYKINRIAYVNELDYGELQGIGTFCHEFGHILGLPDLYTLGNNWPSTYADYWTPTYWDLMDVGCDLDYGYCPPNLSTYERHALGWCEPYELNREEYIYMSSVENMSRSAMIRNSTNPDDVYYFEYRDQSGYDSYHCGSGLLIWHVQYEASVWNSGAVNNTKTNPRVMIVCADGKSGSNASSAYYNTILYKTDPLLAGDPYPGTTGKTTFDAPSSAFVMADGNLPNLTEIGTKSLNGQTYMTFKVGANATDNEAGRTVLGHNFNTTGVESVVGDSSGSLAVSVRGLEIAISGASALVEVFDINGRKVVSEVPDADGSVSLTLPVKGFYLLRSGAQVEKLICR